MTQEPFMVEFSGSRGRYTISYAPSEWGETLHVSWKGNILLWPIEVHDTVNNFQGLTNGTEDILGDIYWYDLTINASSTIEYYVDGKLEWDDISSQGYRG